MLSSPVLTSLVQWLGERLLDGTWLAFAAWLASVTLLKRASGRLLSLVWLCVLASFVVARPFTFHAAKLPALPLAAGVARLGISTQSTLEAWLFAIYAFTVFLLLTRLGLCHWRLRRRIDAYDVADSTTLRHVAAMARALALRSAPDVRVTDAVPGPFTFGPKRPTLVLPRWLCIPGVTLDAVLLHELSHLKRKDHCWIWLQRCVTTLYFFWPPIYWVSRKLEDARELACDELAIRTGGLEATQYSANLLRVIAHKRDAQTRYAALETQGTLALGPNARRLEWRLDRLLDAKQPSPVFLERSCALLLFVCCLLSWRPTPQSGLSGISETRLGEDPTSVNSQSSQSDSRESDNMCLPPAANAPCVLQGCGTQCAP